MSYENHNRKKYKCSNKIVIEVGPMTTSITSVQQLLIIYKVAMQEYFSGSEKATLHIRFLASSSLVSYLTVE